MPLIVPPGFGLAAFEMTGAVGTQPYITTMGLTLGLGEDTAVDLANAAFDVYAQNIVPEMSNALRLSRVTLFVGDDGPSGSVDSVRPSVVGAATASHPPTALSAIARKGTADLGRRGRGRMFIPGILNESDVQQDGSVAASAISSTQAALDGFLDDLVTGGTASPPLGPVLLHSAAPADPTPITSLLLAPLVGWIRGRIR